MDEATYFVPRRLPAHSLHRTSHPPFHSRQFCSGHAHIFVFCWHPELLRFAHASSPRSRATPVCHKTAGLSISFFSLAWDLIPGSVLFWIQALAEATSTRNSCRRKCSVIAGSSEKTFAHYAPQCSAPRVCREVDRDCYEKTRSPDLAWTQ
jgi:hypothetical protein